MRRAALILSSLSLLVVLTLPSVALGHGPVDQQNSDTGSALGTTGSQFCPAQTFTAGRSGSLVAVSVNIAYLEVDFADLLVEIRNTSGGVPGTTVLASVEVANDDVSQDFSWVHVDFPEPAQSVAGTTYAIVLSDSGGESHLSGYAWKATGNLYSGGATFQRDEFCNGSYSEFTTIDGLFQTFVAESQPDGRIRRGRGDWVGGNIYNTTGDGQARCGDAEPGHWRSFRIQVQNDGDGRDKFTIDANGAAVAGYRIEYMKGATEITSAVNQGTFQTRWLDPGERATIEARVKVQAGAAEGSSISRLVTLSSLTDPTKVDSVGFTINNGKACPRLD